MGITGLPGADALRRALHAYPAVVARQGVERLPELDAWYREELPELIASRSPARITRDELVRATEWKMARGVWRAPNLVLVRGNPATAVEEASIRALAAVPDPRRPIAELSTLKGVGAATASAIAAAAAPDVYPFFDEIVAAQLPELGRLSWTIGYYLRYAEAMRSAADRLGGEWSASSLERALWAHAGGKAGDPAGP